MPSSYVIHASDQLVWTTATGVVTYDEVMRHDRALQSDPAFSPTFDHLMDCRSATQFAFTISQVQEIASLDLFSATSRRALVALADGVFGMARMWEAYLQTSRHPCETYVFRDLDTAVHWLHRKDATPPLDGVAVERRLPGLL